MKFVHIHLIINHLVLYGCLFYVLLKIYRAHKKQEITPKIEFITQMILAILLAILNYSGHQAEHLIANYLQDNDGSYMHNHEEWGEWAVKLGFLNAFIYALALKFEWAKKIAWLTLLILLLLIIIAAYYGGQLAHPELR